VSPASTTCCARITEAKGLIFVPEFATSFPIGETYNTLEKAVGIISKPSNNNIYRIFILLRLNVIVRN
jgi:hypothetical protein